MISILIPIYNYNAVPLVKELQKQGMECGFEFEIICIDDCSELHQIHNFVIASLEKCSFEILDKNIGRSQIRNLLATKASYDWLLFLDCDTFPANPFFITNYVDQLQQLTTKAVYGGLQYHDNQPPSDQILRWVYGRNREVKTTSQRMQQPYKTSLVSNFLIQKAIFTTIQFNESYSSYGFEDRLFLQYLERNEIAIEQIDNPVFHLNLETSMFFLAKTREALHTLLYLKRSNITIKTKITATFKVIDSMKLTNLVATISCKLIPILERNLLSKKPSMFLFDLYKIGYFCYLNKR